MFESLALTWPTAFAIVGSVVTIVVGLFGYLKASSGKNGSGTMVSQQLAQLTRIEKQILALETRTLETRGLLAEAQGDIRVLRESLNNMTSQVNEHERRDIDDFKMVNAKIDKLQDVIIRILSDEKF